MKKENWIQRWREKSAYNKYKKLLENTIWIVPPMTLPAVNYNLGTTTFVSDQTVWVIRSFEKGYFFGDSYTSINQVPASHDQMVGSITPLRNVMITFYPAKGAPVNGIGVFQKKCGQHTFIMQTNTSQNSFSGLSHWSYMISVTPDDFFYKHLPGVDMSVPEFIDQFRV